MNTINSMKNTSYNKTGVQTGISYMESRKKADELLRTTGRK